MCYYQCALSFYYGRSHVLYPIKEPYGYHLEILVACPNMPTLPNHAHSLNCHESKLTAQKYCYYVLERREIIGHYLLRKWNDSIKNICQYFNLKLGMIGLVGGRIWAGNQ